MARRMTKESAAHSARHLFDVAVGHDNLFHGDRFRWSARVTVINLTNKEALYNILLHLQRTHFVARAPSLANSAFTSKTRLLGAPPEDSGLKPRGVCQFWY